jgi:hypothetical protein
MAKLTVVFWRDIPSHVIVRRGRDTARAQLSPRFQQAILRAAMRAGKGKSDAYIADWRRAEPRECGDDMEAESVAEAARLEARYTDDDLRRLMRTKGLEDAPAATPAPAAAPTDTTGESS